MRRISSSTIAALAVAGALAAPGAAPASGGIDDLATGLGCSGGHDGLRCRGTSGRLRDGATGVRLCRSSSVSYEQCLSRRSRRPPLPPLPPRG